MTTSLQVVAYLLMLSEVTVSTKITRVDCGFSLPTNFLTNKGQILNLLNRDLY